MQVLVMHFNKCTAKEKEKNKQNMSTHTNGSTLRNTQNICSKKNSATLYQQFVFDSLCS